MAARVEALANQINPHFLFNTLTSISSLIRSQPETARVLIVKLSGLLRRLLAQPGALRHAARGAGRRRRVPRHRAHPLRSEPRRRKVTRRAQPRRHRAEHDPAAARRELDQARPGAQGRRRTHHHPRDPAAGHASSRSSTTVIGIPNDRVETATERGIGLRNVNERLRVIYGANYQLTIQSVPGQGTSARVEIPELVVAERADRLTDAADAGSRRRR